MGGVEALAACLAFSLFAMMQPAEVWSADLVGVYGGEDAICNHCSVRGTIRSRFRHQVTHVPHLPQVDIVDFYGARLTRYEPATPTSPIERRYCQATVFRTDRTGPSGTSLNTAKASLGSVTTSSSASPASTAGMSMTAIAESFAEKTHAMHDPKA